jgi:tetratricopeptide (TPR) repeat protein
MDDALTRLLARIELCRSRGDHAGQRDAARELIGADPGGAAGHLYAGEAELGLKNFAEAEARLCETLRIDPSSADAHLLLASLHRQTRRIPKAEEHVQRALEIAPEHPAAWCELAHLCHDQGDLHGTKRYAERALALHPESPAALNLLGMATPDDSPGESLATYRKALEADPDDPYAHNNMGVSYMELKDYARAEEAFRQALFLQPSEPIFRNNLYLALRHRSTLYRLLTAPGDLLPKAMDFVSERYWTLFFIVAIPAAILRANTRSPWARPIVFLMLPLALFVVWYLVFKPLIYFYEFLMLRDVHLRASGRGGLSGAPFRLRYGLFFAVMCGVWTALGFAVASPVLRPWTLGVVGAGMAAFIVLGFVAQWKKKRREREASLRRARFARASRRA